MSVQIFSWCQHRAICPYVAYGFLGLATDCNRHRSASLKSYVGGIWYWVSGPELSWSIFQFLLWVLHFLTKHNLLLCQQKVFRGCKKIVALVSPAVLLFSPSLCCPLASLSLVWTVDKSKYLFFIAFASFRRECFAFQSFRVFRSIFSMSDFLHSITPKLHVGTGTAKTFIAENLFLKFNSDLRMRRTLR